MAFSTGCVKTCPKSKISFNSNISKYSGFFVTIGDLGDRWYSRTKSYSQSRLGQSGGDAYYHLILKWLAHEKVMRKM